MAEQQSKKGKKRKPSNKSYSQREAHPARVLSRIIQSNGYSEAKQYAEKYALVPTLNRLSQRPWVRQKMTTQAEVGPWTVRLWVGRAVKRRTARQEKAAAEAAAKLADQSAAPGSETTQVTAGE